MLAAHLGPDADGRACLLRPSGPLPGVSRSGPADDPLAGLAVDQEVALRALHVVNFDPLSFVSLAVHHALADALHGLMLMAEFWWLYADALDRVVRSGGYPASVERLLAERGRLAPALSQPVPTGRRPAAAEPVAWPGRPSRPFPSLRPS